MNICLMLFLSGDVQVVSRALHPGLYNTLWGGGGGGGGGGVRRQTEGVHLSQQCGNFFTVIGHTYYNEKK